MRPDLCLRHRRCFHPAPPQSPDLHLVGPGDLQAGCADHHGLTAAPFEPGVGIVRATKRVTLGLFTPLHTGDP